MGKIIILDPGHGGPDPGASYHGYQEKDFNLQIVEHLLRLVPNSFSTRDADEFIPLEERCRIAGELHGELLVSVHCNAANDHEAHGVEAYSGSLTSLPIAKRAAENIAALGRRNRGARVGPYYILKHTPMPAILIECGFVSNKHEASWIAGHTLQIAEAIAKTIT